MATLSCLSPHDLPPVTVLLTGSDPVIERWSSPPQPLLANLAPAGSTADNVAVTTGDLDKTADPVSSFQDEVAVVYQYQSAAAPPYEYKLAVFNFANWTSGRQQVSQTTTRWPPRYRVPLVAVDWEGKSVL